MLFVSTCWGCGARFICVINSFHHRVCSICVSKEEVYKKNNNRFVWKKFKIYKHIKISISLDNKHT